MGAHGKVKVWYMTEEERLAYIKKHPIEPSEQPRGASLVTVNDMRYKKARENSAKQTKKKPTVWDGIDKKELHQMFMEGDPVWLIAKTFKLGVGTVYKYISDQRKLDPEKWPYRQTKKTN